MRDRSSLPNWRQLRLPRSLACEPRAIIKISKVKGSTSPVPQTHTALAQLLDPYLVLKDTTASRSHQNQSSALSVLSEPPLASLLELIAVHASQAITVLKRAWSFLMVFATLALIALVGRASLLREMVRLARSALEVVIVRWAHGGHTTVLLEPIMEKLEASPDMIAQLALLANTAKEQAALSQMDLALRDITALRDPRRRCRRPLFQATTQRLAKVLLLLAQLALMGPLPHRQLVSHVLLDSTALTLG